MNSLITADRMTWKEYTGEESRVAAYTTHSSVPCQWEPVTGEVRAPNGDLSEYRVEVITRQAGIKAGDRISNGADEYEVVRVDEIRFRGRYHHSEVYGQ